jgi:hypothetical protein
MLRGRFHLLVGLLAGTTVELVTLEAFHHRLILLAHLTLDIIRVDERTLGRGSHHTGSEVIDREALHSAILKRRDLKRSMTSRTFR